MISWLTITRIGDSAILMPIALTIGAWLLAGRAWRMAACWGVLFGLAMTAVVATKLAFIGWGIGIEALDFTGISGHATRAAAVFPILFYLALQGPRRKVRSVNVLLGWVFGLAISVSRVMVDAHSVSEAVAGCVLGTMVSLGFLWTASKYSILLKRRWLLAPSLIFLLATPYAKPAPAQQWITSAALYLSCHQRPFDRAMWQHSG